MEKTTASPSGPVESFTTDKTPMPELPVGKFITHEVCGETKENDIPPPASPEHSPATKTTQKRTVTESADIDQAEFVSLLLNISSVLTNLREESTSACWPKLVTLRKQLFSNVKLHKREECIQAMDNLRKELAALKASHQTTMTEDEERILDGCIWWCRLLGEELEALSVLNELSLSCLRTHAHAICSGALFEEATPALHGRLRSIMGYCAEHGNRKALAWLVRSSLISSDVYKTRLTLDQGFRWLKTWQHYINLGILKAPQGDDLLSRLVRDGRDFIPEDKLEQAEDFHKLVLAGLYLNHEFGEINPEKARMLLQPFFREYAGGQFFEADWWENRQVSESPVPGLDNRLYDRNLMSIAWFLWGSLAHLSLYQGEEPLVVPPAFECFKKSAALDCLDSRLAESWVMYWDVLNRKRSSSCLLELTGVLLREEPGSSSPEIWALVDLMLYNLKRAIGLSSEDRECVEEYTQAARKKLEQGACFGAPATRQHWLHKHLIHHYLQDGTDGDKEAIAACQKYLHYLSRVETSACVLVYKACDLLNKSPTPDDVQKAEKLLTRAIELNPVESLILMEALHLETPRYTERSQSELIVQHLPGLSPVQAYFAMSLAHHHIGGFYVNGTIRERVVRSGIFFRYVQNKEQGISHLRVLLKNNEPEKAESLLAFGKKQALWEEAEVKRRSGDIKKGGYVCIHPARAERYNMENLFFHKARTRVGLQATIEEMMPLWKAQLVQHKSCPLAVWTVVKSILNFLEIHQRLLNDTETRQITELMLEAMSIYEQVASHAEVALVGLVQRLLSKSNHAGKLLLRLKALCPEACPKALPQPCADPDEMLLPMVEDPYHSAQFMVGLETRNRHELLSKMTMLLTGGATPAKTYGFTDLPILLHHLIARWSEIKAGKQKQREIESNTTQIVDALECYVQRSRTHCDEALSKIFFALERIGAQQPQCYELKRTLWHRLRETFVHRKQREWQVSSYGYLTDEDQNNFYDLLRATSTAERLAGNLPYETRNMPALTVLLDFVWATRSSVAQRKELTNALETELQCQVNWLDRDTKKQRDIITRILSRLVNKQFGTHLWNDLMALPPDHKNSHYPIALMLIARDIAFQTRMPGSEIKRLFQKMIDSGLRDAHFYLAQWLENTGRKKDADRAIISGVQADSVLCKLAFAKVCRNKGNLTLARKNLNEISNSEELIYGKAQNLLGELESESKEKACQYWSTASRYHHPLAFCRLFACLYSETEETLKIPPKERLRDLSFVREYVELPVLIPSAGRTLCRQLLDWKDLGTFDEQVLFQAMENLQDEEAMILLQLPESFWPPVKEPATPWRQRLLSRVVRLVYKHQNSDQAISCICGIETERLSCYAEIQERLKMVAEESSVVSEETITAEVTEQVLVPAQPELVVIAEPEEPPELITAEQVTRYLDSVLAEQGPGARKRFKAAVARMYRQHQGGLPDLITGRKLKLEVARWLFAMDATEAAMILQRRGMKIDHQMRSLCKRLQDAATLKKNAMAEVLLKELGMVMLYSGELAEFSPEARKKVVDLFVKGAFAEIDKTCTTPVITRLLQAWPDEWKDALQQLPQDGAPRPYLQGYADKADDAELCFLLKQKSGSEAF